MEYNQIPFYARILFVIGIGVALAVALDNIAIIDTHESWLSF
jgi:hypothetical protein